MPPEMESPAVPGGAFAQMSKRALGQSANTATLPVAQRGDDAGAMLFEQERGRLIWRFQESEWNGQRRVQVWPWYRPKDGGDLRPCAERYGGGGFAVPLDRVPELIAALSAIAPDDC
jgi:hypothetical protein